MEKREDKKEDKKENVNLLITGGMGFVGKNFLNYILNKKEISTKVTKIVVIDDLVRYREIEHFDLVEDPKITFYQENLQDPLCNLKQHLKEIDVVIHLAASTNVVYSVQNPEEVLDNNISSTLKLLEACRQSGVDRFIFASTAAANGQVDSISRQRHFNPYGLSKRIDEMMIEMYHQLYGLETVSLRFFNLYGPYQYQEDKSKNVVGHLFDAYLTGKPFPLYGDGEQTRDFVYVDDLSRVIWQAVITDNLSGLTVEVAKGQSHSINQLIETFQAVTNSKLEIANRPARTGEIIHSTVNKNSLSIKQSLNCCPEIGLEEGLTKMLEWIEKRYKGSTKI